MHKFALKKIRLNHLYLSADYWEEVNGTFTVGVGIIDMDIAQDTMVFDKRRGIYSSFSSLFNSPTYPLLCPH